MSISSPEEIKCGCGETFEAELWSSINAVVSPELRETLVSGEINVVVCPKCRQLFYVEHFLIYHDSPNELLAFVFPTSFEDQAKLCLEKMKSDFELAMNGVPDPERPCYEPLLVFGLDALVDMLKAEDELSDELRIMEYVAQDLNIHLIYLHPYMARQRLVPHILPALKSTSSTSRDDVISGLGKLLKSYPHLEKLSGFKKKISANAAWTLDRELIKRNTKESHGK